LKWRSGHKRNCALHTARLWRHRRLLHRCGLPFEDACLSFYETRRAVRTASSEQGRQPLSVSGVGYGKHFAKEIEPLRASLGDCIERFADFS
jgi:hypothetical protein